MPYTPDVGNSVTVSGSVPTDRGVLGSVGTPFYVSGNSSLSIGDGLIWTKDGGLKISGEVNASVFNLIDDQDLIAAKLVTNTTSIDPDTGAAEDSFIFAPLNEQIAPYSRLSWNEAGNLWLYSSPDGVVNNYNRILVSNEQVWSESKVGTGVGGVGAYVSSTGYSYAEMVHIVSDEQFHNVLVKNDAIRLIYRDENGDEANYITVNGSGVYFWNNLRSVSNGTAASPAYTFQNDTNTGLYRAAENEITITTGGAWRTTFRTTEMAMAMNIDMNQYDIYDIDAITANGVSTSTLSVSNQAGTIIGATGTNNNYIRLQPNSNEAIQLVQHTSGGRPYIAFYNRDASGNLDRKGYIGYPEAANNTSKIYVISDQGSVQIESVVFTGSSIDTVGGSLNLGGGVISEVNEIQADVGSVTDPSYMFDSNTTTGLYKSGTNGVGIAGAGEEIALFEDDVFRCRGIYRNNTTITSFGNVCTGSGSNPIIGKETLSSLTMKQDIEPFSLDRALNFVDKAEVIFYRPKEKYQDINGTWSMIGMGAEPVAEIDEMFALWGMPEKEEDCVCGAITRAIAVHEEAVKTDPNHQVEHHQWQHSNECLYPISLKYYHIFFAGFQATQDNRKRIGELEAENTGLKARLDAIEAALDI